MDGRHADVYVLSKDRERAERENVIGYPAKHRATVGDYRPPVLEEDDLSLAARLGHPGGHYGW